MPISDVKPVQGALANAHRAPILDTVLIDNIVMRRRSAWETDHPPRHHAAALHQIAKTSLDGALQKCVKKALPRMPPKSW
jgi:hypothetical protein